MNSALALRPPVVPPTQPPGVVPGLRRISYESLLDKPTSFGVATIVGDPSATRKFVRSASNAVAWDTLVAADVTGDIAATRKFLRSLGSGAAPGVTVWDTITSADVSDATQLNTANKIVKRDGSGNFAAGTITAALNGNATTATSATTATTATTATNTSGGTVNGNSGHITGAFQIDGDLIVGTNFVAGAPAATGSIILKDHGGTPYRFLVAP